MSIFPDHSTSFYVLRGLTHGGEVGFLSTEIYMSGYWPLYQQPLLRCMIHGADEDLLLKMIQGTRSDTFCFDPNNSSKDPSKRLNPDTVELIEISWTEKVVDVTELSCAVKIKNNALRKLNLIEAQLLGITDLKILAKLASTNANSE